MPTAAGCAAFPKCVFSNRSSICEPAIGYAADRRTQLERRLAPPGGSSENPLFAAVHQRRPAARLEGVVKVIERQSPSVARESRALALREQLQHLDAVSGSAMLLPTRANWAYRRSFRPMIGCTLRPGNDQRESPMVSVEVRVPCAHF